MQRLLPHVLLCVLSLAWMPQLANARQWSSTNGAYTLEAELIAFNDTTVVLRRLKGSLVAVELAELSDADKEYVRSKEAAEQTEKESSQLQTWTSARGLKVRGRVLAYGRKQLNVQRQLGKVMINDQPFDRLSDLKKTVVLRTLSHLEGTEMDKTGLEKWARTLGPNIKSYPLEGVLMELESGDVIGVPFFLFSPEDLAILEPGWNQWVAQTADEEARSREDLLVQSQAAEYHRDRQQQQQMEMLKLEMIGRATGLIKVWEVLLEPAGVAYGRRIVVPVHANDSETASQMVLQQYPGYKIIAVKRSRRL
ncbi:SHD1 domain-containing protein [Stieleria varia]|uniref:SLA1 homology domain-containing protein n=1 Tax=Stieleria varia TaxID=2528005 RepID=A0A5C6A0A8_9BACT|nr:SHD1 domain-containing protein [Stieleria varia]TWT92747.1 hypothetical protein Pla52n_61120 [Stieleria varia]